MHVRCIFDSWMCVGQRDVRGRREKQRAAAPRMHTVPHECTCVFSHNGDFSALISANSVASPAVLGDMNIHEVLLSLVKASCRFHRGPRGQGGEGGGCTAEVNQCFIAGSPFLASGRAGGRSCQS